MDLAELVDVLVGARELLARPNNDFGWSSWKNQEAALNEMDHLIEEVKAGRVPKPRLDTLFAPTGPIQEVSLSSRWGYDFLTIAERYDRAVGGAGGPGAGAQGEPGSPVDVARMSLGSAGPSDPRPTSRRTWNWYLGIWSAFNAAAFAFVAWALVSQWPPRGAAGNYYSGPGDGLFFLFFVIVPGGFTFLANSVVLATILMSRDARRDGRAVGWWSLVAAAWILGLLVVHACAPSGRPLPS